MRERILAAAVELTTQAGWARVTMPALAARVGVSRQTIYNEIGSRPRLAELMIMQQLQGFLSAVDRAFADHRPDAVAAIAAATKSVMELAGSHGLLRAIVGVEHGANTELLPLLTSRGAGVQAAATQVLAAQLATCELGVTDVEPAAGVIVRLVLSNVTQPCGSDAQVVEQVRWVAGRLLPVAAGSR